MGDDSTFTEDAGNMSLLPVPPVVDTLVQALLDVHDHTAPLSHVPHNDEPCGDISNEPSEKSKDGASNITDYISQASGIMSRLEDSALSGEDRLHQLSRKLRGIAMDEEAKDVTLADAAWNFDRVKDFADMDPLGMSADGPLTRVLRREYKMCWAAIDPAMMQKHMQIFIAKNKIPRSDSFEKIFEDYFVSREAIRQERAGSDENRRSGRACWDAADNMAIYNSTFPEELYQRIVQTQSNPSMRALMDQIHIGEAVNDFYTYTTESVLPLEQRTIDKVFELASSIDSASSVDIFPTISTDVVIGVSLRFLTEFLAQLPDPDMTTEDVVEKIIKPATLFAQESYVNSLLLDKPFYLSDLRPEFRKKNSFVCHYERRCDCMAESHAGICAFMSHAWLAPFRVLVETARNAALQDADKKMPHAFTVDKCRLLDTSFFWVDVFCKNQHKPAPDMEEFDSTLKAAGRAVISLYPSNAPIAFTRIWCLYELWTVARENHQLICTLHDDALSYFGSECEDEFKSRPEYFEEVQVYGYQIDESDHGLLKGRNVFTEEVKQRFIGRMKSKLTVHIETADARYPKDRDDILEKIRSSMGYERLNETIFENVCELLWGRIESKFGYSQCFQAICFDGNGEVSVPPSKSFNGVDTLSVKAVRDIVVGDFVLTMTGDVAQVVLVTKQAVGVNNSIEMCTIGGLKLTPEHPILDADGVWKKACDVAPGQMCYGVDYIYNFELTSGASSVLINGIAVMTLGQQIGFTEESDKLFGWGWKANPMRSRFIAIKSC